MRRHILILVENLSVPFDRRVWQESLALVGAGYQVTVICPTGAKQDLELEAVIEGVRILRYPLRAATGGPLGYLREYTLALWHTLRLAIKVRRAGRVDIVHACNPPDLLFLIALAFAPRNALRLRSPRSGARILRLALPRRWAGPVWADRIPRTTHFRPATRYLDERELSRIAIGRGQVAAGRAPSFAAPRSDPLRPRDPTSPCGAANPICLPTWA